jgi:hypothetical protein
MPQPINAYMTGDIYAPVFFKPSLQQWDNYQIHSVYCVDSIRNQVIDNAQPTDSTSIFKSFLAVQHYHTSDIPCDFDAICRLYP